MGEVADDMIEGQTCSHCGVLFESAHGYPVLCETCYDEAVADGHDPAPQRATIEEAA